jgi:excisionase family DNA binding protein
MLQEDYPLLLSIQQAAKKIGKSEKTIRRWIHDGKLQAENRGGGYLIKREDLIALTRHVTKEWQEQSDLSHIKLQQAILEGQVEQLKMIVDAQQYEIEELQRQVKKLAPAKKPAPKKKTTSSRTTRHKRDDNFW